MYVLTEYAAFILLATVVGGFSLVAVSTFLIVVEGLNTTYRGLRAR